MDNADNEGQHGTYRTVANYIEGLKRSPTLGPQLTCHTILPGREASYAAVVRPWPRAMQNLLEANTISALYTHQCAAIDSIRAGKSVVVATPTASGKSLVYNLPVIERFLHDPDAKSLYLFPLKALAQDQLAAFSALTAHWPTEARPAAAVYDGDTTPHFRKKIRENLPAVLCTNPEMLHLALLPHHALWATLFAGLSFVVVDEAHTYRGLLGSHMVQVFRRLLRIAALYGANPAFVFCSATVGNPQELAHKLTGVEPVPVLESGAPQGQRHYLFLNPEDSPATTAIALLKAALARGLRTIVYCQSRRMTELISLWAAQGSGPYSKKISAYRAGFLPEERREIEARMNSGELMAVISTSALELGIDIGSLDLCILVGYPGTVMATLQRGGRVGRKQQDSVVILVAQEDALDQYIVRHPEEFFSRPPENAVLNPHNPVIVARHLACAAAELPLRPLRAPDSLWLSGKTAAVAAAMEYEGSLLRSADGSELVSARKRPQREVFLRGTGNTVTIVDGEGELVGSVDGIRAQREAHPGAVYLHRGEYYEVQALDVPGGRALARKHRPPWYTRARSTKDTDILSVEQGRVVGGMALQFGTLRVTDLVTGYERRAASGGHLLGVTPLNFPPVIFETEGFWFMVPTASQHALEEAKMHFMGAIHALEHAVIAITPLLVMTDRNDLGGISKPMHLQTGMSTIFVYDGVPGGAGLSREAFARAEELFPRVAELIASCPCELGCPACVHSPKCGSGNRPMDKEGALFLLRSMLSPGPEKVAEAQRLLDQPMEFPDTPVMVRPESISTGETATEPFPADAPRARPEALGGETLHERLAALYSGLLAAETAKHRVSAPAGGYALSGQSPALPDTLHPRQVEFLHAQTMNTGHSGRTGQAMGGNPYTPGQKLPEHFGVLDVETRYSAGEVGGWNRADRMGVSIAVLYDSRSDAFTAYTQEEIPAMAARLAELPLIIGFNIRRFDYAVLAPHAPQCSFVTLPTLDMLDCVYRQLSYRISLDTIASATLGEGKSASGLQALQWWKEQRLDLIEQYCRKDVEITRNIFLYGRENGHVLFVNKAGQSVRVRALWCDKTGLQATDMGQK